MSQDSFKNDYERIQRQIVTIKSDLNKRDQLKQQGKPTGLKDGDIRGGLKDLDRELDVLDRVIKNSENNSTTPTQQKDSERKRNLYVELINEKNDLQQRFNNSIQQQRDQQLKQSETQFSEKYDTNRSNKELYSTQKQLEAEQDKQLDRVNDKLGNIKGTGQQMNLTVKEQNKQLDQLNLEVDKTTSDMIQTNTKMKKFIATSNSCVLYVIIVIEIALLITLLLV